MKIKNNMKLELETLRRPSENGKIYKKINNKIDK